MVLESIAAFVTTILRRVGFVFGLPSRRALGKLFDRGGVVGPALPVVREGGTMATNKRIGKYFLNFWPKVRARNSPKFILQRNDSTRFLFNSIIIAMEGACCIQENSQVILFSLSSHLSGTFLEVFKKSLLFTMFRYRCIIGDVSVSTLRWSPYMVRSSYLVTCLLVSDNVILPIRVLRNSCRTIRIGLFFHLTKRFIFLLMLFFLKWHKDV